MTFRHVLLAQHRVDFRRHFDGLLAEACKLDANPYAGDCVLFVKRDCTQIRAIVGDPVGLYLVSRRFEGARLRKLWDFACSPEATTVTTDELSLILEGATFTVHSRATPWRNGEHVRRC